MTESENIDQFMARVMGIVNQIKLIGEAIPDQTIIEKFLISLSKKFEMVVTTILESKDLSNFSTDELMGSLLSHETRLHLEDESIYNAFKNKLSFNRGRGRGRGRGHRGRGRSTRNHHSSEGHTHQNQNQNFHPQRGRGKRSNDKASIQCYYCKKVGHYESKCRKKQAYQHSGREHVSNHEGDTSDGMFLSCHKTEEQHKKLWLLDSG